MPVLVAEPDPNPLLRLLNGLFVLEADLGDAALQILNPSGRVFGSADRNVAKLGLCLPLEARSARSWTCGGLRPSAPSSDAALQGRADRALVSVLDGIGAEKSHRWMAEE